MGYRLLLADESITIQKVVELILSEEDFDVKITTNGREAFNVVKTEKPDIILADVSMSEINGYELCRKIKNDSTLRTTPVILLVAAFDTFNEEKAKEVKANGHLTKPFGADELLSKINEALEEKMMKEAMESEEEEESLSFVDEEGNKELETQEVFTVDKESIVEAKSSDFSEPAYQTNKVVEVGTLELPGDVKKVIEDNDNKDELSDLEIPVITETVETDEKLEPTIQPVSVSSDFKAPIEDVLRKDFAGNFPGKDDIAAIIGESGRSFFEQNLGKTIPDLTEIVKETVNASFSEKDEILKVIRENTRESINQVLHEIKPELTNMVKETVNASFSEKDEILKVIRENTKESINQVLHEVKPEFTSMVKETVQSAVPEQDKMKQIIEETTRDSLEQILKAFVAQHSKEFINQVMHDSLVGSMKEVIRTVAWEVIPEVASAVVEEEIKKISEA